MTATQRLLPEWADQEAIILAWPDEQTDWAPWLNEVRQTYLSLISAINQSGAGVLLLVRKAQIERVNELLFEGCNVVLLPGDYNDTWVRDYGFLTCSSEQGNGPVEFRFNGWGNKFHAEKDNLINQQVLFPLCRLAPQSFSVVVEGGALEIDDVGNLLSTEFCLSNPERNGSLSMQAYRELFAQSLGATQTVIFKHGHLEGDDTDGHVDTLVRFTPTHGLVIQSCFNRPHDPHFNGLDALVRECQESFPAHEIYELPLPEVFNAEGERLPASYANYLICNGHVLCPVYQQPEDDMALTILARAYAGFTLIAIDALPLIQQFGSVHCISMQVPAGTLKSHVVNQLSAGVSVYEQK